MVDVVKNGGMPVDIMMVSKSFEIEFFELIDVFILILSCLCSFILLMNVLLLSKYCSCSWLFWFRMSLNFHFIFVSLTFLSDLMKWLQYGCQRKLVNDFIMILLCFQHFQFYSTCIQTKIVT